MFCSTPDDLGFLREELRHLSQLVVFPAAVPHTVDEQSLVAQLFAEGAVYDVLQRLESFAAPRQQRFRALALEVDARAIAVGFHPRLDGEPHVSGYFHDEVDDLLLCAHFLLSTFYFATGAPASLLVSSCWPMMSTLLANQYNASPAGEVRNRNVNITGMNSIIFC